MDLSNEKIIHKKLNNQEFIEFKRLNEYSSCISHAYSLGINKTFRTFNPDGSKLLKKDYDENLNNYKELCLVNKLDYKNLVKARQDHTDNILIIDEIPNNETIDTKEKADGLITNKPNIILATTNADCILLLMFDPKKKVIANIHSGWKGTLKRISQKAVKKMVEHYGCKPGNIIVSFSPSIRKCHFEVEEDVYKMFCDEFKDLENINEFIIKNGNKWNIDTILINKILLMNSGIRRENIEDSGLCSVCNKNYIHSFRAEGDKYGLATALIAIKG